MSAANFSGHRAQKPPPEGSAAAGEARRDSPEEAAIDGRGLSRRRQLARMSGKVCPECW